MIFIGIAIALTLAASLELEVDLLSIFDSLKRADGWFLKRNCHWKRFLRSRTRLKGLCLPVKTGRWDAS